MSEADKITIKPFKPISMKGFTKEENDYFWNKIKEKSITINIDSNADKSLEELGYSKIEEGKRYLRYHNERYGYRIDFELVLKEIRCTSITHQGNTHFRYFSLDELQAINQKVKELGWV